MVVVAAILFGSAQGGQFLTLMALKRLDGTMEESREGVVVRSRTFYGTNDLDKVGTLSLTLWTLAL